MLEGCCCFLSGDKQLLPTLVDSSAGAWKAAKTKQDISNQLRQDLGGLVDFFKLKGHYFVAFIYINGRPLYYLTFGWGRCSIFLSSFGLISCPDSKNATIRRPDVCP